VLLATPAPLESAPAVLEIGLILLLFVIVTVARWRRHKR